MTKSSTDGAFQIALGHVLAMEGGWYEDPIYPGGPGNCGISLATFAHHRKVALEQSTYQYLREQLRNIQPAEVAAIYREAYWTPSRAGDLPAAVSLMHFDAAVHHGLPLSARMLRASVDLAPDGDVDQQTIAACAASDASELIRRYADHRRFQYSLAFSYHRYRLDATVAAASNTH